MFCFRHTVNLINCLKAVVSFIKSPGNVIPTVGISEIWFDQKLRNQTDFKCLKSKTMLLAGT